MLQYLSDRAGNLWLWKRLVLTFVLLSLLYFWYSSMMLHHVYDSPFKYKGADMTYWFFDSIGVPTILTGSKFLSFSFSCLLVLSFAVALLWIENRWLTILAGLLLLIYQVVFNMKIGYHTHHLFGFQFALLPFYFSKKTFPQALGLARTLTCLSYFFAGFFKLYQKAWLVPDSFAHVLENQHAAYFYFNPNDLRSVVCKTIIEHPVIGYAFFVSAMLLQLSFAIGLFTNKYNRILALFILLFHVMDWFLMNLGVFMGMTVLMWVLLYKEKSESLSIRA